jgi:hypothetical protein
VALAQIVREASSKEAARALGISPRTVEFHRTTTAFVAGRCCPGLLGFNIAQVDGYDREPVAALPETERLAHAETFITNLGIKDGLRRLESLLSALDRHGTHAAIREFP